MTPTQRKAMEQALDALVQIHPGNMTPMAEQAWNKAIITLRAALAEQPAEQEQEQDSSCKHCTDGCTACDARKLPVQEPSKAEPQEPVACSICDGSSFITHDDGPRREQNGGKWGRCLHCQPYTAPQPAKPIEIDWSQAGSLMDAAASAKHAGCMTGTTNWAAHVYRYMVQAKPAKRVPLTDTEIFDLWGNPKNQLSQWKFARAVIAAYDAKNGIGGGV